MDSAASRDLADFDRFCHAHFPRLVGLLSHYCGDRHVAEELAQEALARTFKDWKRVARMAGPEKWLTTVALNLARSHFRRAAVERRFLRRERREDHHDLDAADKVSVRATIAQLPSRQKTALLLRYYADLPITEIAELMQCAEGTVKTLLHRAVQRLGGQLRVSDQQEVIDA